MGGLEAQPCDRRRMYEIFTPNACDITQGRKASDDDTDFPESRVASAGVSFFNATFSSPTPLLPFLSALALFPPR